MPECEWCGAVGRPGRNDIPIYTDADLAVFLRTPSPECETEDLVLVPAAHVGSLGELAPDGMADVLAALRRLTVGAGRAFGEEVRIAPHVVPTGAGAGHLHFHVTVGDARQGDPPDLDPDRLSLQVRTIREAMSD